MRIPLIITLFFLFLLSCKNETKKKEGACCTTEKKEKASIGNEEISDESVYLLNSKWEKEDGKEIALKQFTDKTIVAAMIFTNCPSACPRIVADMKVIEKNLTQDERKNIQFLLISMDPERDTPERMATFKKEMQLGNNWTLIRSDKYSTLEFANVVGVRIKPLSDGGFDHSNIIHILNKKGEIKYQQNGLNLSMENCLDQIRINL